MMYTITVYWRGGQEETFRVEHREPTLRLTQLLQNQPAVRTGAQQIVVTNPEGWLIGGWDFLKTA
jgi:hypothetical protein